MNVRFTCPDCGLSGSVDAVHAGKIVRCKQCGCRAPIPRPGQPARDEYALEEPATDTWSAAPEAIVQAPAIVTASGREKTSARRPGRRARQTARRVGRQERTLFSLRNWLIGSGVAIALGLVAVSLLVRHGTVIAGCIVILIGSAMLMTGYFAGAYGAFSEDFLYGFLYIVIPLYTAYYLVTRWDDLWIWCACSTAGVGLILLGTEIIRWDGIAA
jgi:hypothetical protein